MPGAASRGCCSSERGGTALTQRGPAAATQGMLDRMDHRGLVLTALAWTLASACASDGSVGPRSEEHTSELQSQSNLVCRLLLEKKKKKTLTLANELLYLSTEKRQPKSHQLAHD